MEVQHHHHNTSEKKKRLWEYVFEFLMLFLAVTAGFYSENLRERHVERTKEHEYMQSLLADLGQDSIQMNRVLKELPTIKAGIDSLATACYNEYPNDSMVFLMYALNN